MSKPDNFKELHFLSPKELNFLLESIDNLKHKVIILLMSDCGLRVSETVSLKVSDFDFRKKILFVKSLKKRGESHIRKIPLSDRLYRNLADYLYNFKNLNPDSFIFPNADNSSHLERFAVNRFLYRLKKKTGFTSKLHPHALRHTFATNLITNAVPLENIKILLGHKDYNTTLVYAHIPDQVLKQNIETITTKQTPFFRRIFEKLWYSPPRVINIRKDNRLLIGRQNELDKLNSLVQKGINVCIKGNIGTGKNLLLDSISTNKKVLVLDDTNNIKKSLVYMLVYLFENDKESVKNLLYSNFDTNALTTKLNRESIPNLTAEITKLVEKNKYILKINEVDQLTPRVIKVISTLKDYFTIITTAREIPLNKADFLWSFELIEIKNLSRAESFELIQKLSYDLEIEDFEMYRNHIFEQTNGNPQAIIEMVDRYRKEPFILRDTIRSITHSGALREYDMSYVVMLMIASVAILRYLTSELDNPSLRFIGGCAMILLLFSRTFFGKTKRRYV
jgi:integrase/recombinase XerD